MLEAASVIGLEFARPALEELAADTVRQDLDSYLRALTANQFVRPDALTRTPSGSSTSWIHDATYNRLLKRRRAELHERFVAWAERVNQDRRREVEYELLRRFDRPFQARRALGRRSLTRTLRVQPAFRSSSSSLSK